MVSNKGAGPHFIPGTIILKIRGSEAKRYSETKTSDTEIAFSLMFGVPTVQEKSPNQEVQETCNPPSEDMKVDNITLMMFVLNFVEFCFILELI